MNETGGKIEQNWEVIRLPLTNLFYSTWCHHVSGISLMNLKRGGKIVSRL